MTKIIERQPDPAKKLTKLDVVKKLEQDYEYDSELVQGIFRNLEHRGGMFTFMFKKYKQDEYRKYQLIDGERYRLPRMVVKHLNNNVHYLEYKHAEDSKMASVSAAFNDGSVKTSDRMTVTKKIRRCEFLPLEFSGESMDLMPSDIVQVTRMA